MPREPLISVIIPVYNLEKDISRTLDSVCLQTYHNLQIIIVNDGSTDDSLDICRLWAGKDDRILLIDKRNEGLPMARKSGLEAATGEYVHHLDGGDYIDRDMYHTLVEELDKSDFPDVVVFGFYYTDELSGKLDMSQRYPSESKSNLGMLKHIWQTQQYNAVWQYVHKRTLACEIAFHQKLNIGEDTWYTTQLIYNTKTLKFIDMPLYFYVINDNSMTRKVLSDGNVESLFTVLELIDRFMRVKPEYQELSKEMLALRLQTYATILLGGRLEYMSRFNREFRDAFQECPQLQNTGVIKKVRKIVKLYSTNRLLYHVMIKCYRRKGKIRRLDQR